MSTPKPILRSSKSTQIPIFKDQAYKKIEPLLHKGIDTLTTVFEYLNNQGYSTFVRKKTYASSKEKLVRKGLTDYLALTDLVKGVVFVNDVSSTPLVLAYIETILDVIKVEYKTGNELNPYKGFIHVDVIVDGVVCEIQITTEHNWEIKRRSNDAYKKGNPNMVSEIWDKAQELVYIV
jgi:hypothetical protein